MAPSGFPEELGVPPGRCCIERGFRRFLVCHGEDSGLEWFSPRMFVCSNIHCSIHRGFVISARRPPEHQNNPEFTIKCSRSSCDDYASTQLCRNSGLSTHGRCNHHIYVRGVNSDAHAPVVFWAFTGAISRRTLRRCLFIVNLPVNKKLLSR